MRYIRAIGQYWDRAGYRSAWLMLALILGLALQFAAGQEVLVPRPDGQSGKFFAFGLADVLSRDLRPNLCALDRFRE
jgi:hypothetical protein